jgi:serine/threonine protein kinase
MGSVWRARHRTLGRSFAIKFLKTAIPGGQSLEQRFLGEARMAASIQHRFVVDIVDFGVTPQAVPYMVMEFLHGESLERRCRRQPPMPVAELLRIGAEVLLGLEAVHQAGIVHRDLKPENIMLVHQADGTIPKLVDFGISRLEVQSDRRITQPGAVLGTPWYMSPEQARRDQTDRRSDIYSVGVILYEALAGEPPFDHQDLSMLLELVRAGGATPLVQRRPELGEELSALIERALALDPSARFESAAQMSARLLEVSGGLPADLLCVAPPSVSRTDTEVLERPARRRTYELEAPSLPASSARRRPRALAVAAAVLAAGLLAWTTLKDRSGKAPVNPATAQAAVAAPEVTASEEDPGPSRGVSAGRQQTLTERMPSAAPSPAPEEHHRHRSAARTERRDGSRGALPEVFRTPGF